MKSIFTAILLFSCLFLFGQSDQAKKQENSLGFQTDEQLADRFLQLSETLYKEGLFEKSSQQAEKAFETAKKLNNNLLMAKALNQNGKALVKIPGSRNNHKNKAFKSFEESNSLTTDKPLRLDNLQQMKDLAMLLNKRKDLDNILRDIAILKGETPAPPQDLGGGLFGKRRKEAIQQYQQAAHQQNLALEEKIAASKELLKKKEAAIQNMSAEQARRELLISEQERSLDVLTFSTIVDSMELSHTEMIVLKQESELLKRNAELELQKSQQNLLLAIGALIVLIALGLFYRYMVIRRHHDVLAEKNKIIEEERKRSEELLLNILPVAVAEELKRKGTAAARHYEQATVLFTDFEGFSAISQNLSPGKLVHDLDYAFRNFDRIIGKHGLEKIKTIGDSYMCAGGLPGVDDLHPASVVKAALEIQQFLTDWNKEKLANGEPAFEARIGIHTGPLVAGVVGSRKFAYDIWGDTVNIASRMESNCQAGKVNISSTTFARVKDDFDCEYRGKVPAKNVGDVDMYYVRGTT